MVFSLERDFMQNIFKNKLYFFYLSVVAFLFAAYAFNPFTMDDFYLHTEMGKWIVTHKEIPNFATGSWFGEENNVPWVGHEWLSQVIFYEVFVALGNSVDLIHFFCFSLCVCFIFNIVHVNREEILKHYFTSYVYLAIITLSCYGFFVYRPQIFSFFLFWGEIYCLRKFKETLCQKTLYPIPVLAVLWSNLHGGSSSLVYIVPILFVIFNHIPIDRFKLSHRFYLTRLPFQKTKLLIYTSVASFFGLFINPYGFKMILYPYVNMADKSMLTYIMEWVPLNILMPEHVILIFPVLAFAWFSLFQTKHKIDVVDFMFLLTFTIMTFKSGRFIMYFTIYSSFCMWRYFNSTFISTWKDERTRIRHNIHMTTVVVIALLFVSAYKNSVGAFWQNDDFLEKHKVIIATTKAENPKKIWNRISGNELMAAGIKPFVDERADAFTGEPFLLSIKYLDHSSLDPEKMIKKYSFDYVILSQSDPMMIYINHCPEMFQLIYKEEQGALGVENKGEAVSLYKILNF